MSIADEARAEAERYSPPTHEGLVPVWVRAERTAFIAGAEWQASRKPEAAPSDTDLQAELSKVGLPETASLADLIQHHRANAGVAAALDALSQPVQVEVTDDMVEKATRLLANGSDVSEYPFTALDAAHMRDKARQILEIALGGGDHAE